MSRATDSGLGPPSKGGSAKNLYTKSARLTLNCRATWALSVRVNLYNRQTLLLPREPKHMQHSQAQGHLPDRQAPAICTPPPPVLLAHWRCPLSLLALGTKYLAMPLIVKPIYTSHDGYQTT